MLPVVLHLSFGMLSLAIFLGMVRLARGPTVIDRIMGFDLVTTSSVGIIILLSIRWETAVFLELILIFSLLGFFGTVAYVFYLSRLHGLEQAERLRKPKNLQESGDL